MMRRVGCNVPVVAATTLGAVRYARYSSPMTMAPVGNEKVAHRAQGQLSFHHEVIGNPDHDEDRKMCNYFDDLPPKREEVNTHATYYHWGRRSSAMFMQTNEDPGEWWNAHNTTVISQFVAVTEMSLYNWNGVTRPTSGAISTCKRPHQLVDEIAGATRDTKSGALKIDYKDKRQGEVLDKIVWPHLKEHAVHRRLKIPGLTGFREVEHIHAKRQLREVQYHLGWGLKVFNNDGFFGSHPATSTGLRLIHDNAASCYVSTVAAIRDRTIFEKSEALLTRRLRDAPLDHVAWRRPPVVVYNAPAYEFEQPRIVEEFGGPRPQDLSLTSSKFVSVDPYSIPMRGIVAGDTNNDTVLDTTAYLAGRWGFYADDKELLTFAGDAALTPDGSRATLLLHGGKVDVDALRRSNLLLGAHHFRFGQGLLSRAWNLTTIKAKGTELRSTDLVEESYDVIRRPLSVTVGGDVNPVGHRFTGKRGVAAFGNKYKYGYSKDAKVAASRAGNTFGAVSSTIGVPRPSAVAAGNVDIVIVADGNKKVNAAEAAKLIVAQQEASNFLYAEADRLEAALTRDLATIGSIRTVSASEAASVVSNMATKGTA